jgi:serine/alanine adding enzyme
MVDMNVYTTETIDAWRMALDRFPPACKDVYYRPEYFMTWAAHEAAAPHCLHLSADGLDFLYPFFRKPIDAEDGDSMACDIFSAYGYGGMIASAPPTAVSSVTLARVNRKIDEWCREYRVVAEFVRQNPLFTSAGKPLRDAGHTIVRRNVYRYFSQGRRIENANTRRKVSKARRSGLEAVIDVDLTTLPDFDRLYRQTAERIGMAPYYLFGSSYTSAVDRWMRGSAVLVNIVSEGTPVAASLVFQDGPFTTYHLSGSDARYLKRYPNDLLLASLVDMADVGVGSVLSLGGGLGNDPEDSLYAFKKRFGNITLPVSIGKNVHNEKQYRRLCDAWADAHPHLVARYRHYFLKYRMAA